MSWIPDPLEHQPRLTLYDERALSPWHSFTLAIETENVQKEESWSFTYADYKTLDASKRKELMVVPAAYDSEYLVPMADYLQLKADALYGKIPFIWLCTEKNELVKAAVHNHWVVSCQERIEFWEFLKDWAGKGHELPSGQAQAVEDSQTPGYEELKAAATTEAVNKLLEALLKD